MSMDNSDFRILSQGAPNDINIKKDINLLTNKHKFDKLLCENILNSKIIHEKSNRITKKKNNKFAEKGKTLLKNTGRWTTKEHTKFIEGILKYGTKWKLVEKHIETRSAAQARSHAQKFFLKLSKQNFLSYPNNINDKLSMINLIKEYSEKLINSHKFNEFKEFLIETLHDTNKNIKKYLEIKEGFLNFLSSQNLDMNLKLKSKRSPRIPNYTLNDKTNDLISDKRNLFVYVGSSPIKKDIKDELNLKLIAVVNSTSHQSNLLPNPYYQENEVSSNTNSRNLTEIKEYNIDNIPKNDVLSSTQITKKSKQKNCIKSKSKFNQMVSSTKYPFSISKIPKKVYSNIHYQRFLNLQIEENSFNKQIDPLNNEESINIPNHCMLPCVLSDSKVNYPSLLPLSSDLLSSECKAIPEVRLKK